MRNNVRDLNIILITDFPRICLTYVYIILRFDTSVILNNLTLEFNRLSKP